MVASDHLSDARVEARADARAVADQRNGCTRIGTIRIKRIYDPVEDGDCQRVLVDRLWPRGLKRGQVSLHLWLKDIAPSAALRTWFGHRAENFADFAERYRTELDANPTVVAKLQTMRSGGDITLLYAARDPHINHATILADYLLAHPSCA